MVQSLSNFTRNALEMPKTPIANAIVELNHKKKSLPVDMIGTMLKMRDIFFYSSGFTCSILAYVHHSAIL